MTHRRFDYAFAPALAVLLGLACSSGAPDGSAGTNDGAAPPATDSAGANPGGLAVVHNSADYTSALLSLVDPATATLVRDNCLSSGSKAPQLSQALSGDVVLPSAPLPGHPLVLIDRTNNALVWVNPVDCTVTQEISVSTGFLSNPHDVVAIAPNKFYVTRYSTNPSPSPDPSQLDGGGDLLILDLDLGRPIARIDLAAYAAGGAGIRPNPDRARVFDGKIYVTLNNLNVDPKQTGGPGRVVVVDPTSDTVTSVIELPDFKNCSAIAPVPGQEGALAVVCEGAWADGANQINASGVALIDTSTSPATVQTRMASDFGRPLSYADLAVVNSGVAFAVVSGDFSGSPPDQLWQFDFAGGLPQKLLDASTDYVLGGLVFDPASQRLFLGDADPQSPRLHVFDVSVSPPPELSSLDSDPGRGLQPRYLGLY
jgi:hypothetical protein